VRACGGKWAGYFDIQELPPKEYTVIVNEYYNRGNHPPMPVFIWKKKL
jgi:hypothetical protein